MIDEITWLYLHQVYLFKDEDEFQDYLDYVNPDKVEVKSGETIVLGGMGIEKDPSAKKEVQDTSSESDEYIIPYSNTRYLTDADLDSLSEWDLKLARNEIYARHGRRFRFRSP